MDPIQSINPKKDTTLALLLAFQRRGWTIDYLEFNDMVMRDGVPAAAMRRLTVRDSLDDWFEFQTEPEVRTLHSLDVILMRKDPPFDSEYIFSTYLLERAQAGGALVINDPRSLRDANEKLFTAWFAEFCPPTIVTRNIEFIREFLREHRDIVVKPLDGMGGKSIFRVKHDDVNANVIYETLTGDQSRFCMAQRYVPEIVDGDKRILLIDGEPIPYALARVPSAGDFRGNLAAGGTGRGQELSARDREICAAVGPTLRSKGLHFVGLDVIGDYLTEINVTSPTCVRELEAQFDIGIADRFADFIARRLEA
jgi:glutathione synthase